VQTRDEAERYCSLIEQADSFSRHASVAAVAQSPAGLLTAVPQLPDVPPTGGDLAYTWRHPKKGLLALKPAPHMMIYAAHRRG
jgi:hypothetical protein